MPLDEPPTLSASFPSGLNAAQLTAEKEKRYHGFVVVVSILVWLALLISVFGVIYGGFIGILLWLGHGLLAAHLRAEAVRVSERQWPELYASFLEVCQRLGFPTAPRLYVLQAGGALNAFATRHAGRDFVVVYSDFVEAFAPNSAEMKFILGHELGHVKSRHNLKQTLLAPGLFCPLLGSAYRRAWETSCDRYGAFAAQDMNAALRAMLTLSGGKQSGRTLDPEVFASQHEDERGFFVSLHELTSSYPTLSRRVRDLRALQTGTVARSPDRHPIAYLVALILPGGHLGAGAAVIPVIFMVGLLAAMAIPAFQKVRQASVEKACYNNRLALTASLDEYLAENSKSPSTFADVVGKDKLLKTMPACPAGGTYTAKRGKDGFEVNCSVHGHEVPVLPGAARP